jgi:SAM-dependent methyltransferase
MTSGDPEMRDRWIRKLASASEPINELDGPPGKFTFWRWKVLGLVSNATLGRRLTRAEHHPDLDHFMVENTIFEPSRWSFLPLALPRRHVGPDDVFVDFGCGDGQVLYQAARRYRCRRVIGVELSPSLAAIAVENLERNAGRLRTQETSVVVTNATEWDIPDDLTIAYFYFPFDGAVFQTVLDNIVDSLARHPRRFRIAFAAPVRGDTILATGVFGLARRRSASIDGRLLTRVHVYDTAAVEPGERPSRIAGQATG